MNGAGLVAAPARPGGSGEPLVDFGEWLAALLSPNALTEAAALLVCLALAWGVVALLRRAGRGSTSDDDSGGGSILLGRRGWDGVLFPLLSLLLALLAQYLLQTLLQGRVPMVLFRLALPLLASLCLIRLGVRVLQAAYPHSPLVRLVARSLSWLVWLGSALWITGALPFLLTEMEGVAWHIGGNRVTLRSLVEGALSAVLVLVLALWLSASIETRLLAASAVNLSVRKIAANATRAALLLIGLLLALSAAGIPLAALSVMGGALGVGIGLGLQKLAANYVSGFVILAERSLRIGDVVKVDGFEGRITDISTRYTVIRALNGRESIVPNEMMVTQRVENCSFADPRVALTSRVQVAYGTDLEALIPLLVAAMGEVARVVPEPGPAVQLSHFAADGLDLTLAFWIADMENGDGNVRSDVNLAVLKVLAAAGVEIPFPQRVVRAG